MKVRLSGDQKKYLELNLTLFLLTILFPLYHYWVFHYNTIFSHCLLKEWFGIYCPLCGGTRCLWELMQFHFLAALRYNAYVVLLVALILVWDILTLVRFLRGKKEFWKIPQAIPVILIVLLVLFFIARTVLLLGFQIDPIGDLVL